MERRGQLSQLIDLCKHYKPNFEWQEQTLQIEIRQIEPLGEEQCQKILAEHLSLNDLQHLCFLLGIQYEALPGDTKKEKINALFNIYQKRGWPLARLVDFSAYINPDVFG